MAGCGGADLLTWAKALTEARRLARAADLNAPLSALEAGEAYAVQRATVGLAGGQVSGYKIGWASPEARLAHGVSEPIFGRLLAEDVVPDGGVVSASVLIQPRVEGELVAWLERELEGSGLAEEEVRAVCSLGLGFDLFDSRLSGGAADWRASVADNCGVGRTVLGSVRVPLPEPAQLADFRVELRRNGELAEAGLVWEKLGGRPLAAVAWLAGKLAAEGESLHPGQFVLLGAVAGPLPLVGGEEWMVSAPGLGEVQFSVRG